MGERLRVAVTGADGLIGTALRERLDPNRFDLRPLNREDADITDLAALEGAFAGRDAVVHLAGNAHVDAEWEALVAPNLVGVRNAYEAAFRAGVRRVVFASSNHAIGRYLYDGDVFADPAHPRQITSDDPVRPDSLYGATKVWGEALGRYYAEVHGLEVVCLRIGWVTDDDRPPGAHSSVRGDPAAQRRAPGMWLSQRDCATLVAAALTAPVGYAIVNGVSGNAGRWLGLDDGRRALGWEPQDGLRA